MDILVSIIFGIFTAILLLGTAWLIINSLLLLEKLFKRIFKGCKKMFKKKGKKK